DTLAKHPGVPVTPEQIANAAIEARNAGATIAHIHVRDPKTGKASQSVDYYRDVVERIRASGCDVLINLTTGPGSRFVPSDDNPKVGGPGTTMTPPLDRVRHVLELLPDICSLDVGSMNFGETGFVNTPAHLRTMAEAIAKTGVKPELEVFEPGHVMLARRMVASRSRRSSRSASAFRGARRRRRRACCTCETCCRRARSGRASAFRGWNFRWSRRRSSSAVTCASAWRTTSTSTTAC